MSELQRVLAELDNLSAQLEAEEATNDRLRDEIAESVGAQERMAAEVERLKRELDEARAQIWLERVVRDKALDELLSIRNVQEELRKGGK